MITLVVVIFLNFRYLGKSNLFNTPLKQFNYEKSENPTSK